MTDNPHDNRPQASRGELEERLVAYLDGELEDAEARQVEEMLSADSGARGTLMGLDRTWSLLDQLDRARLDESFTRSTLEMVAVAAEEDVRQLEAELPRRRVRQGLAAAVGLAGVALAGFLAVACLRPDPNTQLLRDLPVLEDFDELRQIDDVEFLKQLYDQGLFVKDAADEG